MTPIILITMIVAALLLWTSLGPTGGPRRLLGGHGGGRRCSRCWRVVERLQPYVDGRKEIWICQMCAAEMDFANAKNLDLPS